MAAWDPFRDFETLRQEIDRAFEQAGLGPFPSGRVAFLPGQAARHYPLVNLHDDGQNGFSDNFSFPVRSTRRKSPRIFSTAF
jgi:hypothetical protein